MNHEPLRDPGNDWAEKMLSVRIKNIRAQWINLGERQKGMLDNLWLSAEHMEERLQDFVAAYEAKDEARLQIAYLNAKAILECK